MVDQEVRSEGEGEGNVSGRCRRQGEVDVGGWAVGSVCSVEEKGGVAVSIAGAREPAE